jgi:alpha-L-fucosidase
MATTPKYLENHADLWKKDPHAANLAWFGQTRWGLFMHYGLYSQLGRGEWVMFQEQIPVSEYEKLFETFDPTNFDADYITDLALEAEMQYVTFTACHHEGFCLWRSDVEAYNSYRACGRDLVRELAEQCDRKGLGFFTYFTHVLNWRHPWSLHRAVTGDRPSGL